MVFGERLRNNEFIQRIKADINDRIEKAITNLFFKVRVTDIIEDEGKKYITGGRIENSEQINRIKLTGIAVGNGRGVISLPRAGDVIVVMSLFGEYFYVTSVYDEYSQSADNQIPVNENELMIVNKSWGSFVKMDASDNIILNTFDGAKIRVNKDGSFKMYNKDNYGIESNANGDITIRGKTVNHTQTPGQW